MIKNIKELKKCQIVCRNQEQVKDCLNYLKQLGFRVEKKYYKSFNIIFWGSLYQGFIIFNALNENLKIEFYNKKLIKTLQKFIKEKREKKEKEKKKVEDFEVAEDGRIIKINNFFNIYSKKMFSITNVNSDPEFSIFKDSYIKECINKGLVFATAEARDKAMFKLEIETKLKNIAEKLNAGRKIDWKDKKQYKFHIYYDYRDKILEYFVRDISRVQGAIYCLDENFLNVAKQEIGEENLIKYFKE